MVLKPQVFAHSSRWEAGAVSGLFFFLKAIAQWRKRRLTLKILLATGGETVRIVLSVK
jgi:hypothetical protein